MYRTVLLSAMLSCVSTLAKAQEVEVDAYKGTVHANFMPSAAKAEVPRAAEQPKQVVPQMIAPPLNTRADVVEQSKADTEGSKQSPATNNEVKDAPMKAPPAGVANVANPPQSQPEPQKEQKANVEVKPKQLNLSLPTPEEMHEESFTIDPDDCP